MEQFEIGGPGGTSSAPARARGFAGTIKRWNFHRGPMCHGSMSHRRRGPSAAAPTPSRVVRGKKMPAQMGNAR